VIASSLFIVNAAKLMLLRSISATTKSKMTEGRIRSRNFWIALFSIEAEAIAGPLSVLASVDSSAVMPLRLRYRANSLLREGIGQASKSNGRS
jgi:hypothetical protein